MSACLKSSRWPMALLAGVGMLTGCISIHSPVEIAEREAALAAVPGVTGASIAFEDDASFGSTITANIGMPNATAAQIRALVHELKTDDFIEQLRLAVSENPRVHVVRATDTLAADVLVDDAEQLRRFEADVSAVAIGWSRTEDPPHDVIAVLEPATSVPQTFTAIREVFGAEPVTADVSPAEREAQPRWRVAFPLSLENERRIGRQIAALPVETTSITLAPAGAITNLNVSITERQSAYEDLRHVVTTIGTGQRWRLAWHTDRQEPRGHRKYAGSVDVGGCDYPANDLEEHPDKYRTADSLAVQHQLREEFDACPR